MTPPQPRGSSPSTYVVCLDCGKRFEYDWKQMRIGPLMECSRAVGAGRQ